MKTTNLASYVLFRERLTKLREEAGCTQAQLGHKLDKPQSYVSKVEAGERRLDLVEYVYWCRALGKDPATLITQLSDELPAMPPRKRQRVKIIATD